MLAENLELPQFNATIDALSTVSAENLESTKKYLELAQIAEYDKLFNDAVKEYEEQFKLQSLDIQRQATIQAQDASMQAGEGVLGNMSTGAQADFRQDLQQSVEQSAAAQQSELVAQYANNIEQLATEYDKFMVSLLGENFEVLAEYNDNADLFGEALLEEIANNAGLKYSTYSEMLDALEAGGFIKQYGDTASYTITVAGQTQISNILQSMREEYGDYHDRIDRLVSSMAKNVMSQKYPTLDTESETYAAKEAELTERFDEWLRQNSPTMYYTDLGLATFSADTGYAETPIESVKPNTNIGDSWNIYAITPDEYEQIFGKFSGINKTNSKQTEYLTGLIDDMRNGIMSDGSYFIANYGYAKDAVSLFYYSNGYIYATDITIANLPDGFDLTTLYLDRDFTRDFGGIDNIKETQRVDLQRVQEMVRTGKYQVGYSFYLGNYWYQLKSDGTLTKRTLKE